MAYGVIISIIFKHDYLVSGVAPSAYSFCGIPDTMASKYGCAEGNVVLLQKSIINITIFTPLHGNIRRTTKRVCYNIHWIIKAWTFGATLLNNSKHKITCIDRWLECKRYHFAIRCDLQIIYMHLITVPLHYLQLNKVEGVKWSSVTKSGLLANTWRSFRSIEELLLRGYGRTAEFIVVIHCVHSIQEEFVDYFCEAH